MQCRARSKTRLAGSPFGTRPLGMYTTTSKCPSPWRAAEKTQPGIRARVHHLWECLKCTNSAHATSQHSNMFHPWLALEVTTIGPTGLRNIECSAAQGAKLDLLAVRLGRGHWGCTPRHQSAPHRGGLLRRHSRASERVFTTSGSV